MICQTYVSSPEEIVDTHVPFGNDGRYHTICNSRNTYALETTFPRIVEEVAEFVKQHGFAAECRRRGETSYSSGVTINQIREHLYVKIPELKDHTISLSTIRRVFEAPNKGHTTNERYKGYVSARVGTKFNSCREPRNDARYLFARNKMRREMASLFKNDIRIVSVDDVANIKVSAPAVCRYHQVKRIFSRDDNPNRPDHDFPVPGYHLTVSGYMY